MTAKRRTAWTFAVTSAALFMASLDNLVVTTALPSIRDHLHASLQGLQWTVNAYTLTFAVLLLTGATLGERYGRRRLFVAGLGLFTAADMDVTAVQVLGGHELNGGGLGGDLELVDAETGERFNVALGEREREPCLCGKAGWKTFANAGRRYAPYRRTPESSRPAPSSRAICWSRKCRCRSRWRRP